MTRMLLAACVAALLLAVPAAAVEPTQITIPYNEDVVVNYDEGTATYDPADAVVDPDYGLTLATQAAVDGATSCGGEGTRRGLPDSGVFPATSTRPAITLATDNANTGDNAQYLDTNGDSFSVDVPDDVYAQLQLFAVGGRENDLLEAEFTYTDASTSSSVQDVPRWYEDGDATLVSRMDWMSPDGTSCQDYDHIDIFSVHFPVDQSKTLASVVFTRVDPTIEAQRRISVFGGLLMPGRALTVAKAGSGGGVVRSTTDDIDCGATCSKSYVHGTTVTLSPRPDEGSTFAGWSGACTHTEGTCTLLMTEARSVTATFQSTAPPPEPQPQPQPQPPSPPVIGPTTRTLRFAALASARRNCARRRLRLAVDDVPGETIVEAVFRIGNRARRRRAAQIDDPFFFRRVGRRAFRLRVEMKTADGDTLRSSRRFRRCGRRRAG